jgi:hypothetical protein
LRVRIESLSLNGTTRQIEFRPGLNVITGSITTGKTTLMRLVRGLLGADLAGLAPEVGARSPAVTGTMLIGDDRFLVVRPVNSSPTATIEIAGEGVALRLPLARSTNTQELTYGRWLLDKLDLPRISVPSAPTRIESEPTPVSIRDYLNYCELTQSEIDDSVFGHHDAFKNIKRKYVFEILYGKYDVETAAIQEQIRDLDTNIRALRADRTVLERLLTDTVWENRADLERKLTEAEAQLREVEERFRNTARTAPINEEAQALRQRVAEVDELLASARQQMGTEKRSIGQLDDLTNQLKAQSARLTRSIVAGELLVDFEFLKCPRCGSQIGAERGDEAVCRLCLQHPTGGLAREDMVKELQRVESQIQETSHVVSSHRQRIRETESQIHSLERERETISNRLNFVTESYVSDAASEIRRTSELRTRAEESVSKFREYLGLYEKWDRAVTELASLQERKRELEEQLAEQGAHQEASDERIANLSSNFATILGRFNPPRFPGAEEGLSFVDPNNYLPVLYGRRFDELSSQGLKVMVNVAHAIAHQQTAMDLDLKLPNILFIDGVTSNIGHREDLDRDRVEAIYKYLIDLSNQFGERLQLIVADNDVPDQASDYIIAEFTENDRLVPMD